MVDRLFMLKENGKKEDLSIKQEEGFDHPQKSLESDVDDKSISDGIHEDPLSIDNKIDENISTLQTKKEKKQRRILEQANHLQEKRSIEKKSSWYKKIDLIKPLVCIAVLFLIYFMWIKRDIWITRLLTSNNRVQNRKLVNEQELDEKIDSSNDVSLLSSNLMKTIDNNDINDDQTVIIEDSIVSVKKSNSDRKTNIRAGRVKVSFSKERRKKKNHPTIDDDQNSDDLDDDHHEDTTIDEEKADLIPSEKSDHHHHRSIKNRNKIEDMNIVSSNENLIEQLEKLVKKQGHHQDFHKILKKETRLSKSKLTRLIEKKDYELLNLDVFISLLNSFHLTLLILPK